MGVLAIVTGGGAALLLAYLTYARWLGRRVFRLDADRATPACVGEDGRDFVPTGRSILFGHHFTSIAGTGPIVGPAIAVMWGWLPAVLWVVIGAIFIGMAHDFGSLVVSMRNKGRSIGDIAGDLLGPRARILFLSILIVALWIVLAVFGLVIAAVLREYPAAITPVLAQIPLALIVGVLIHRRGKSIVVPSVVALGIMMATVWLGAAAERLPSVEVGAGEVHAAVLAVPAVLEPALSWIHWVNTTLAGLSIMVWTILLLGYAYIASVLPVWSLLQPRDYINALQLVLSLGLLLAGLVAAAIFGGPVIADAGGSGVATLSAGVRPPLEFVAPVVDLHPAGSPPLWPMLFITIACGACSGFHCLVASGTTAKQVRCETHARPIAAGSMLTEGFLAVLVIAACAGGLGLGLHAHAQDAGAGAMLVGGAAFQAQYASWETAGSLGMKVSAFVQGGANFVATLGIPLALATALIAVMVAAFAATTMDTACRLQRYVIQDLARLLAGGGTSDNGGDNRTDRFKPHRFNPFGWLATTHGATIFAVSFAFLLALGPSPSGVWETGLTAGVRDWFETGGRGGLMLWPLFGATNQLLAGLAFIVIVSWLRAQRRPVWFLLLPALVMLVIPACAITWQAFIGNADHPSWITQRNWLLVGLAVITLALEAWLVVEASIRWRTRAEWKGD